MSITATRRSGVRVNQCRVFYCARMPVSAAKDLPPGTLQANFHASLLFLRCGSLLSLASSSEVSPFHKLSFVRATPPEYLPHDKSLPHPAQKLAHAAVPPIRNGKNWFFISLIAQRRIWLYFTSFVQVLGANSLQPKA